jgi:hypothetical protein
VRRWCIEVLTRLRKRPLWLLLKLLEELLDPEPFLGRAVQGNAV